MVQICAGIVEKKCRQSARWYHVKSWSQLLMALFKHNIIFQC